MARNLYRRRVQKTEACPMDVEISEEGNIRSLHLGSATVQSSMDLDDPARLVLSYSRAMMSWLLFCDAPKKLVQVGLGGGSFTRWLDLYLPEIHNIVIEINPQVITVARSFFELPFEEEERFEIIEADGAEYIKVFRDSVDVILVDGFDGLQIADELVTESFFEDCRQALSENGIFVTNLWSGDKRYQIFMERLLSVFKGYVLEVPATSHGNVAVLAFKNKPGVISFDALNKRAEQLQERYHLEFTTFVSALKSHNLNNGARLSF